MVVGGVTVIAAVVSPPGDHRYEPPEGETVAIRFALCPIQIVVSSMLNVGFGVTVTVVVSDTGGH